MPKYDKALGSKLLAGHDRRLGCVRLLAEDVALVWEELDEGSEVVICSGSKQ